MVNRFYINTAGWAFIAERIAGEDPRDWELLYYAPGNDEVGICRAEQAPAGARCVVTKLFLIGCGIPVDLPTEARQAAIRALSDRWIETANWIVVL